MLALVMRGTFRWRKDDIELPTLKPTAPNTNNLIDLEEKSMIRPSLILTIFAALFLVCACANPASDKPAAVTNEAAPVAASSPGAQGQRYLITPDSSEIKFVGSKVTGSHNGSFKKFSGTIDFTGQPETSRVSITIDTDAHDELALGFVKYGVSQARRAWVEKESVINCLPFDEFEKYLKNGK